MPRQRENRVWEYRGYWLTHANGSDAYYLAWYDERTGKGRRKSLGAPSRGGPKTRDEAIDVAQPLIQSWATPERHLSKNAYVGPLLEQYLIEHAVKKKSGDNIARRVQILAPEFSMLTVSELTQARQWAFIHKMHAKHHYSSAYLAMVMKALSGALSHAWKSERLESFPHILTNATEIAEELNTPAPAPRERVLDLDEIAMLFEWTAEEHIFRFLFLSLATGGRPEAITDLSRDQFTVTPGYRFIELNPPGRRQSSKFRPTVPLIQPVLAWLPIWRRDTVETKNPWGQGSIHRLIHRRGQPVAETKKGIRDLANRVGLHGVTRYTLRHTVATWLRQNRVDKWEVESFLGHRKFKSQTDDYAKYDPDYLSDTAVALESLFENVASRVKRPMLPEAGS